MPMLAFPRLARRLLLAVWCAAVPVAASAGTLSTIYTLEGANDGAGPNGPLTKLDGVYYGTTQGGGAPGLGTVFRIELKTGKETIVHAFAGGADGIMPMAGLTALEGKLYGTTSAGGSNSGGTVFEIDPATDTETVVYDLPNDTASTLKLVEFGGLLYGGGPYCGSYRGGCLFSVNPASRTGQIVYSFDTSAGGGFYPVSLMRRGDVLFGSTDYGGPADAGTIFRFDPASGSLRLEYAFAGGNEGAQPNKLVGVNGVLYGTTYRGGKDNDGIIFAFDPETGGERRLHDFRGVDGANPLGGLLYFGYRLYGTTTSGGKSGVGVVFSIEPAYGFETLLHSFTPAEGGYPVGELIGVFDGKTGLIYGTAAQDGPVGAGSVFSIDAYPKQLSVLHSFSGSESSRASSLIKVGEGLYGTASGGGSHGLGSIFRFNPAKGVGETLHSFTGEDGARPEAALADVGGTLYGTTSTGGALGDGTVFDLDPKTHALTTLVSFGRPGCRKPNATLVLVGNALYGTGEGGHNGKGCVFKFDLASLEESTVFSFTRPVGTPQSGLILVDGLLYGTAIGDGIDDDDGTIFSIDPTTGAEKTLFQFDRRNGNIYPVAGLLHDGGKLFGFVEGVSSELFSFDLAANTMMTLHRFRGQEALLGAPLIAQGDKLFGTLEQERRAPNGAILRIEPASGRTLLSTFASAQGGNPTSALLHSDGAFYGTTRSNDPSNAGTVFRFKP